MATTSTYTIRGIKNEDLAPIVWTATKYAAGFVDLARNGHVYIEDARTSEIANHIKAMCCGRDSKAAERIARKFAAL